MDLLKSLVSDPLRTLVRVSRAKREHQELLSRHNQILDQNLLEDAQLVADRYVMLERMPKKSRVAEIGVAQGNFSKSILKICEPVELHLIDPWNYDADVRYSEESFKRIGLTLKDAISMGQVVLHRGYSFDVLPKFGDDYFDWVYIDGAHDYDSVRNDLHMCRRVVKRSGLIAGHDYVRWGSPTTRYGVLEAVNEFASQTRSPFRFFTNQYDKHDSFALVLNK